MKGRAMRHVKPLLLIACCVFLAGCADDPFQRQGNWVPTGAARQNLAAQAADPADLIAGHGVHTSNGVAAVAAVDKALGGAAGTAAGLQVVAPAIVTTN